MSNLYNYYDTAISGGSWASNTLYYTISGGSGDTITLAPETPKAESALEWLDRRVDEMRVKL